MSTKHLYPSSTNLVNSSLKGLIALNPTLRLLPTSKIVYDPLIPRSQIAVISGGGGGHEPAHAGYVGKGMLNASVSGEVFASPSARQVQKAVEVCGSSTGTILVVTNYTGDVLNFGLAAEKINSALRGGAARVGCVIVGDDVAVGKKAGGLVGRRGLAGTILVSKILGAASSSVEGGLSFDELLNLGGSVSSSLVTIAASLDHCHVPGRTNEAGGEGKEGILGPNECELGMGLHNEPGYRRLSNIPSASDLVSTMLDHLINNQDQDRSFVPFKDEDEVVLLLNNLGGMSCLEMGAMLGDVLECLEARHRIRPTRTFSGTYMTSLNAPGFSITLLNVSHASRQLPAQSHLRTCSVPDILGFIDAETEAVAWSGGSRAGRSTSRTTWREQIVAEDQGMKGDEGSGVVPQSPPMDEVKVDSHLLEVMLRRACERVIVAEPQLTAWDTVMGDGDCGETVARGAKGVLSALDAGLARNSNSAVHITSQLSSIVEDNMGGTLGAIFAIFLAALTSSLRSHSSTRRLPNDEYQKADIVAERSESVQVWIRSGRDALHTLMKHTPARKGDRTVMDALVPFIETLASGSTIEQAIDSAHEGAESTRRLKPKLGRATYVGNNGNSDGEFVPDPGAFVVYEIVRGLREGIEQASNV